jgi:hypothetical protein
METATVRAADRDPQAALSFRRFVVVLLGFIFLPPLLLAALVAGVDPFYVFGAPSVPGINAVRPYYETAIFSAKPAQVQRLRPNSVALGSSRVEVGLDPRHPGWAGPRPFNFGLPGSTSYEVMLAFLHAQAVGRPLEQAVVGLDFFGFNIFFPRTRTQQEARLGRQQAQAFADFLAGEVARRMPGSAVAAGAQHRATARAAAGEDALAENVHEQRTGALATDEHANVRPPAGPGSLPLGRPVGTTPPRDWDESGYLDANPEVRIEIALGAFPNGYLHYLAVGRELGLLGGFPPVDAFEALRLRWPALNRALLQGGEMFRLVFSRTAARATVATPLRQSMAAPFDDAGVRLFPGQEELLRRLGGTGHLIRSSLASGAWGPWLNAPRFMYCFTNADSGMSMFDPFRFMLRRAYAQGTDVRMFVTPVHAVVRVLHQALGLGERHAFWLKELVRLNEVEAALAEKPPLPLWDFSNPNTITREPIPSAGDLTPMRWFWEHSHYRKVTGDLILDRVLGYSEGGRPLPADFGVRLTSANVDAHIARARSDLAAWASANSDLVAPIMRAAQTLKALNRQGEAACW